MARVCQVTGTTPGFGHHVSHSHRRTKRRFDVNIQSKRYWVPSLRRHQAQVRRRQGQGSQPVTPPGRFRPAQITVVSGSSFASLKLVEDDHWCYRGDPVDR